jgi:hypothetical protein
MDCNVMCCVDIAEFCMVALLWQLTVLCLVCMSF